MRNIEIKARLHDPAAARDAARRLADSPQTLELEQTDTYFQVPHGRLKLREERGTAAAHHLVFYHRPDQPGPKSCEYSLVPVPDPGAMKSLLAAALGVRVVVDKQRTVYFHKNVRMHLDRVRDLGEFLEFEAVMSPDTPEVHGEPLVRRLMHEFAIADDDLIHVSYCDMLLQKQGEP